VASVGSATPVYERQQPVQAVGGSAYAQQQPAQQPAMYTQQTPGTAYEQRKDTQTSQPPCPNSKPAVNQGAQQPYSGTHVMSSTGTTYSLTTEQQRVVETWKDCVAVPLLEKAREERPLVVVQTNGHCLSARKHSDRYELVMEPVKEGLQETRSAWVMLDDGKLMSQHYAQQCLARGVGGSSLNLAPCEQADAMQIDVEYKVGRLQDRRDRSLCLNMGSNGTVQLAPESNVQHSWGVYQMRHRSLMQPCDGTSKSMQPFGLLFGGLYLVLDKINAAANQLTFTQKPLAIQAMNWAWTEQKKLYNLNTRTCLSPSAYESVALANCTQAPAWNFDQRNGQLQEAASSKYLVIKDNSPALVASDKVQHYTQKEQWKAMKLSAPPPSSQSSSGSPQSPVEALISVAPATAAAKLGYSAAIVVISILLV
jgi:hypothetical protein